MLTWSEEFIVERAMNPEAPSHEVDDSGPSRNYPAATS